MFYIWTVIIIILHTIAIKVIDTRITNSLCYREIKIQHQLLIMPLFAFSCNGCRGLPYLVPDFMANSEVCSDFRFRVCFGVRFAKLLNWVSTHATNEQQEEVLLLADVYWVNPKSKAIAIWLSWPLPPLQPCFGFGFWPVYRDTTS